jgi:hypothetical protein
MIARDKKENRSHRSPPSVLCRRGWPISVEDDFPMALDKITHRLFRGFWKSPQLLVSDTETGRHVPAAEIARKKDDLFYDSAPCVRPQGEGYLEVFEQKDAPPP